MGTIPTGVGELDRQITFQQLVTTQDETGQLVKSFENLPTNPTVWARVESLKSAELVQAASVLKVSDRAFIIRYRSDLDRTMRVVFDGKNYDIYDISEPDPGFRYQWLRVIGKAVG